MSRLEVRLRHRTLWSSGDVLVWAELDLELKDSAGGWRQETFRVDSGTDMTTMPAADARARSLPMPTAAVRNAVHAQTGLEFRSGLLRARIVGMDLTEYVFPCFFLGDPSVPFVPARGTTTLRLLGLSGVLNQVRLIFDGTPSLTAPYGNLIVEKM